MSLLLRGHFYLHKARTESGIKRKETRKWGVGNGVWRMENREWGMGKRK